MKIEFHGAAETVTGSKHLITTTGGKKILLDCGMFQGSGKDTETLNRSFGFDPSEVDYMILSHAHIDHSGLIPRLVKEGYKGKIYATHGTVDLTEILLLNSAFIQESDIRFINKKRQLQGKSLLTPLYSEKDVRDAFPSFVKVEVGETIELDDEIKFCFYDAGHIVGAATISLQVKQNGRYEHIIFSGDVGRYGDPILRSPVSFPQADYIIIESTYGDKKHEATDTYANVLKHHIQETCVRKKGKLIIPAFSVGRTQELLFALNELYLNGELPHLEYFVDSPLSIQATEIVKQHPECFNKAVHKLLKIDYDPFQFPGLHYVESATESKQLNTHPNPCVVISASGMAEAGRVKHHIANSIENKNNTILMVGYCEPATLGARLKEHPEEIGIFGEKFKVKADIEEVKSMSAHADYDDLCQYLACQDPDEVKQVFVVHGEPEVQLEFKRRLIKKGFKDVVIPGLHEEVFLSKF